MSVVFRNASVSVHFLEKWRHFVSPKKLLSFGVKAIELGLGLGMGLVEMRFQSNVFSSKCGRFKQSLWTVWTVPSASNFLHFHKQFRMNLLSSKFNYTAFTELGELNFNLNKKETNILVTSC